MTELKEAVDKKIKELKEEFETNKNSAMILVKQKNIIEARLTELVSSGSLISAKIAGLKDISKE